MTRQSNWQKRALIGLYLGLAAVITNSACLAIFPNVPAQFGNIFVFLACGALGLWGALVAIFIGSAPLFLLNPTSPVPAAFVVLCLTLAAFEEDSPRSPLYLVGSWLWGAAAVVLAFAEHSNFLPAATINEISARILIDSLSILSASLLLLHREVWSRLSTVPRSPSAAMIVAHFTVVSSTLGILVLMYGVLSFSENPFLQLNPLIIVCWFAGGFWVPSIFGWRAAPWLRKASHESWRELLNTKRSRLTSHSAEDLLAVRKISGEAGSVLPDISGYGLECGSCILSADGKIRTVNQPFRNLIGLDSHSVSGKNLNEIPMPAALGAEIARLVRHSDEEPQQSSEVRVLREDGSSQFIKLHVERVLSNSQAQPDIVILSHDISARRTVSEEMIRGHKMDSLGSLMSGIGEELLTHLQSATHAIKEISAQQPSQQQYMEQAVLRPLQRAENSFRQILDFAARDDGESRACNLISLIEKKSMLLSGVVSPVHQLEITRPSTPLLVRCKPELLMQAITNVLMNARESYAERGRPIYLSIGHETLDRDAAMMCPGAKPGQYARIKVKDFGCGMTQEVIARACEANFSTKQLAHHRGLGLAIVYAIARSHDGFLTIESASGKGTTVSLFIPLAQTVQETSSAPEEELPSMKDTAPSPSDINIETPLPDSAPTPRQPRKVMIVDDDPVVRSLLTDFLSAHGHTVLSVASGKECLEQITAYQPDVLFLDYIMPDASGPQILNAVRASSVAAGCRVPIVMLSAEETESSFKNEAIRPDRFLKKPCNFSDLLALVSELKAS